MTRYRCMAKKRSPTAYFPVGVVALFLMTACSPPDLDISPGKPLAEQHVEAEVETFFEYLEDGEPGAAIRTTNLGSNARGARVGSALLEADVYAKNQTRLARAEAKTRRARPPLALVDSTSQRGERARHESALL